MTNSSNRLYRVGMGVPGWLGTIFVTLKLCNIGVVASWPWIWVLCPFWIGLAILLAALLLYLVGAFVAGTLIALLRFVEKSLKTHD